MSHSSLLLHSVRLLVAAFAVTAVGSPVRGDVVYTVAFDDPNGLYGDFYGGITSHTLAAGADWAGVIGGSGSLDVVVRFDTAIPRATGRSLHSVWLGHNGTRNLWDQGAASELKTGVDPNGSAPDIEFVFNPEYLQEELWFDVDPLARTADVPNHRTDAMSVFLHEIGHALGFNGWRNGIDGGLPTNTSDGRLDASTFDELTVFDGTNFYFVGALASALYGGPIPLTYGNIFHLGNDSPRPGTNLIPDLMNGVVFFSGDRYEISPLDVAILRDTGLPPALAAVPEPSSLALTAGIFIGAAGWRARRGKKAASSQMS